MDDLSLTLDAGDLFGSIGHNGAGKTTTLKCVAGILPFEAGEIFIDGKSVKAQPIECKRVTAYIPDSPDFYEYLTGIHTWLSSPMFSACPKVTGRRPSADMPACSS